MKFFSLTLLVGISMGIPLSVYASDVEDERVVSFSIPGPNRVPIIRSTSGIGPLLREINATSFSFLFQGDMPPSCPLKRILSKTGQGSQHNKIVLRLTPQGTEKSVDAIWDSLNPQAYNMTEISCEHLSPDTTYLLEVGYTRCKENLQPPFDFMNAHRMEIKTLPFLPSDTTSVILFSCWRHNKYGPIRIGHEASKQAWESILNNIARYEQNGIRTDAIWGMGDTVYQDPFGPLGASRRKEDFIKKYVYSFSLPAFKEVTSKVPFQSIADDHAVRNGSGSREDFVRPACFFMKKAQARLFDRGMDALRLCELPHDQSKNYLWRKQLLGQQPVFWADLRRERQGRETLMHADQFNALKDFLLQHKDRIPILIFSVPFSTQDGNESCTDYPHWQKELMEFAHNQQVRFTILSGDTHVGFTQVFQAHNAHHEKVGPAILEATVSGLNAIGRGKAATTKSLIDRTAEGGLLFSSIAPDFQPSREDVDHPILTENLFARLTIHHGETWHHIEYFRTQDAQKILGLKVIYKGDIFEEPTMKWDNVPFNTQ